MFNKTEMKSEKNNSHVHTINQLDKTVSSFKEKKQNKIWPKAFNPFISNEKIFPKSWSRFPLNS